MNVVEICADLIRLDTSNYGRKGSDGELAAAQYVLGLLARSGYTPLLLESEPGRANVVLRVPGTDSSLPGLLVHGHLDVVPADPEQWSVPPFGGVIAEGYLWGRGATDMKSMVATMIATLLAWSRDGAQPRRDVLFAFVADEEEDGQLGAEWLVREHPALFAGVEVAIGESGGVPVQAVAADGTTRIIVPVAVAERGSLHMSVEASGTAGHGSRPNPDNPVARLVHGLSRLAAHRWPLALTPTLRTFLTECGAALQLPVDLSSEERIESLVAELGPLRDYVEAALRSSTNLTVLEAGYKMNVIPSNARAEIDVRSAPGEDDEVLATIDQLLGPGVVRTMLSQSPAISAPIDSPWFDAIKASVRAAIPGAVVVPFCMAGGTDAKPFAKLDICGYGFAPLGLDPDGRTASGIHGVDERVPVAALNGSVAILRRFLETV